MDAITQLGREDGDRQPPGFPPGASRSRHTWMTGATPSDTRKAVSPA